VKQTPFANPFRSP
jgi:hypothetical protein